MEAPEADFVSVFVCTSPNSFWGSVYVAPLGAALPGYFWDASSEMRVFAVRDVKNSSNMQGFAALLRGIGFWERDARPRLLKNT